MICNECLDASNECLSPKRKQPNSSNFIQRTIDVDSPILSLAKTVSNDTREISTKLNRQKKCFCRFLTLCRFFTFCSFFFVVS